jgi:hypothetical protein
MASGVPILVKIGLKTGPSGSQVHDFPDWTVLPLAQNGPTRDEREALAASHQIVKWHHDNVFGHADDAPDSPIGTWLGTMVVSEQFADEVVAMLPDKVSVMTEAEFKTFYETRCMIAVPTHKHDTDVLHGLKLERELRAMLGQSATDVDARIALALDPTTKVPGVREQRLVKFDNLKADTKLTIIDKTKG